MLMVVNLEDGIPPNLIREVADEDLDKMGEYELVKCLFTLPLITSATSSLWTPGGHVQLTHALETARYL